MQKKTRKKLILILCLVIPAVLVSWLVFHLLGSRGTFNNNSSDLQDTVAIKKLHKKAWANLFIYPDSSLIYIDQAEEILLGEDKGDIKGLPSYKYKWLEDIYNTRGVVAWVKGNYDDALEEYEKSRAIAERMNNRKGIGRAYHNIGLVYESQFDYTQAFEYFDRSSEIKEEIGDRRGLADSYNSIGNLYNIQSKYDRATQYYLRSLKIYQEIGDYEGMSMICNNLGLIFRVQNDYQRALEFYNKSFEIEKRTGNKYGLATVLNNMGGVYRATKNFGSSERCFRQSLSVCLDLDNKYITAVTMNGMGNLFTDLYSKTKQSNSAQSKSYLDSASHYLEGATALNSELNDPEGLSASLNGLAQISLYKKEYQNAIGYYKESLRMSDSLESERHKMDSYKGLSETYRYMANNSTNDHEKVQLLEKSMAYYKKFVAQQEALMNSRTSNEIGQLSAAHEMELSAIQRRKEAEENKRIQTRQRVRRNNLQYSGILIGILIMLAIITLLSRRNIPNWLMEFALFVLFLIFFEFILVLLDPYVDVWSKRQPAYLLLINAVIAALIFPLHRLFEKAFKKRILKNEPPIKRPPTKKLK